MLTIPLVEDNEAYILTPGEFRFREACLYYTLYMNHHGPEAGLKDNRFRWMSFADAFLMMLVSIQDVMNPKPELYKCDTFRFLKVMRNITVHQAVVMASSPFSMVNRIITLHVGSFRPDRPDHEDPILVSHRIAAALDHYEAKLRAILVGTDYKTGKPRSLWDREGRSIQAARRWNTKLAANPVPKIRLSQVFFEGLNFVSITCGIALTDLPLPSKLPID